jgi:hypothetical protein
MKTRFRQLSLFALIPLVVGAVLYAPSLAAQSTQSASNRNPLDGIPVTGTIVGGGTFQGTLDIVSFGTNDAGALVANGLLDEVLRPTVGNPSIGSGAGNQPQRTCAILDLELGPLDLDLLGLVVHLDRINLEIDAVTGPGNLLGNLLCAIVSLLDDPLGNLDDIIGLLNRIIDLLGR